MRSGLRSITALRTHASWARALTAAVTASAVALLVLAVLYVVRPADVMPPLVPGLSITSSAPHRYRLAAVCVIFALMLGYIAILRWRIHRNTTPAQVQAQRAPSVVIDLVRELPQEANDVVRALEREISSRR